MIGSPPLFRPRNLRAGGGAVIPLLHKSHGPHQYGCLMAMLPEDVAEQIRTWAYSTIPLPHLGQGGFETEPHVTILYGFTEDTKEQVEAVSALLTRHGPISLKLGVFKRFVSGGEDGDVLYVEVDSPDLHDLNRACRDYPHTSKFPKYKPHVTVAYLHPSFSSAYCALGAPFTNTRVTITQCQYSTPSSKRTHVKLGEVPVCPTCGGQTLSLGDALVCAQPPCEWSWKALPVRVKDQGQPCEQGETAASTGCIPSEGGGTATAEKPKESAPLSDEDIPEIKHSVKWADRETIASYMGTDSYHYELRLDEAEIIHNFRKLTVYRWTSDLYARGERDGDWTLDRDKAVQEGKDYALSRDTSADGKMKRAVKRWFGSVEGAEEKARVLLGAPEGAKIIFEESFNGGKELTITVKHPDIRHCRRMLREHSDGTKVIYNENLILVRTGTGFGTDIFASQIESAAKAGFAYIKCYACCGASTAKATKMNGYYTWPLMGYNQGLTSLAKQGPGKGEETIKEARKLFPDAQSVLDIFKTEEGQKWWLDNGCGMYEATFDLGENSRSRMVLEAYLEQREERRASGRKHLAKEHPEDAPKDELKREEIDLNPEEQEDLSEAWRRLRKRWEEGREDKALYGFAGIKGRGQPCKQGEAASRTGCIPAGDSPPAVATRPKPQASQVSVGKLSRQMKTTQGRQEREALLQQVRELPVEQAREAWYKSPLNTTTIPRALVPQPETAEDVADNVATAWRFWDWLSAYMPAGSDPVEHALHFWPKLRHVRAQLSVRDPDSMNTKLQVAQLAALPEDVLRELGGRGARFWISDQPAPEHDDLQHLRNQVPRGYPPGRTWSSVPGVYNRDHKHVVAGDQAPHGCASLVVHETGHALGDLLGYDRSPILKASHQRLYRNLDPYLGQDGPGSDSGCQELLAESLATLVQFGTRAAVDRFDWELVRWLKEVVLSGRKEGQ